MIDCPIPDMKRFVAGLLKTAMQTVYPHEAESIRTYCSVMDSNIIDHINQTQQVKSQSVIDMKK
jgi:hypothetical protein